MTTGVSPRRTRSAGLRPGTWHVSCRPPSAEEYLRRRGELTGMVVDQAWAVEIADASFGALLAHEPGIEGEFGS